jgi:hypothetical protein
MSAPRAPSERGGNPVRFVRGRLPGWETWTMTASCFAAT